MKIDLNLLKEITEGVENITENNGVFTFYRRGNKDISTSGVVLRFMTSATRVSFGFEVYFENENRFGCVDFCQNGVLIDYYAFEPKNEETLHADFSFDLPGEKLCEIYLPQSVGVRLFDIEVDGEIKPLPKRKVIMAFGDDITCGNGSKYSSLTLMNRVAGRLGMSLINKSGNKSGFNAGIIQKENVTPDMITVMYGTFDFENAKKDDFVKRCSDFFVKLKNTYTKSKIYAITPLWRQDFDMKKAFGTMGDVRDIIIEIAEKNGIVVIAGDRLTPHEIFYFSDFIKYPNDLGVDIISENLVKYLI